MKVFKEIVLKFFALCILIVAVVFILGTVDIINLNKICDIVLTYVYSNNLIVIGISALVAILAIIAIFVVASDKDEIKTGIAIKRETGNVYISKETFESIVVNVTKSFASLKNYRVSINITEEGIIASVFTYILPDTVVPTITSKLQENIKDAILKQTTVELKEVNVKIKGVYAQAEKTASQG